MQNNPLVNKTFLLMITNVTGEDVKFGNLSIQKGMLKSDGNYDVNCVAASDEGADKGARTGKYTLEEQSDKKSVIHFIEETGQFTGEYQVTINWLDKNTGAWHGKKDGNGSTVIGVIKTID